MDQLRQDVGIMVEKITKVIAVFRSCHLRIEEYVCLKVLAMVAEDGKYYIIINFTFIHYLHFMNILDGKSPALDLIYKRYLNCLKMFTMKYFPSQPNRVEELLIRLPEVSSSTGVFLFAKFSIYIPQHATCLNKQINKLKKIDINYHCIFFRSKRQQHYC